MDESTRAHIDVLGLGAVSVDDLLYVDTYPPCDAKAQVRSRRRQFGGLTGTALVTVARLGGRAAYAGVLGDDELSEAAIAGLAREGVDLTRMVRRGTARPIHSTIVVSNSATRNIFFDTAGVVGADDVAPDPAVIRRAGVLLVDNFGVPGMIRAAAIARDAGIPVVGDFESDDPGEIAGLLPLVDHLIVSSSFAERLTQSADAATMVDRLWSPDRRVVVVTFGAGGIRYRSRDAQRDGRLDSWFQPAFEVIAVDSTGCGDVFHGAYAFALARGLDLPRCLRVAAATAAIKATQPGGQAGIPDWTDVMGFLRRHDETPAALAIAAPQHR